MGTTEAVVVGTDARGWQEARRWAGFDGILAPSGALDGERTLVVFPDGMAKVVPEHSRVQRPPTGSSTHTHSRAGDRHRHRRAAL